MKKLLILFIIPLLNFGQDLTYIPDNWFEAYLENNGIGNGIQYDDSVFTAAIDTVTYLDLSYGAGQSIGVFDLTGIEDFTNLEYIGADNLELTKENSFIRLSRLLGKDFNESDKDYLIDVSFDLKRLFIKKIFNNLNSITKDKNKDLVMTSIGEGNFLMKELCELYNIKYVSIENESFLSINNVKRDLVYKNFTSALVVNNYINKKL